MRKIFMIESTIPANRSTTPEIDTEVDVKGSFPYISKIFAEDITGGKIWVSLHHKEDSVKFLEEIDIAALHRDNREKQSIDYRSGKYVFKLENLTAEAITARIYLEGVYSL